MNKADFWLIIVCLLVFLALLFIVMNIYGIFPTPSAEALAKSVVAQ